MDILEHFSLATTTLLGVMGALTGNPSIQASSYIPNIIEQYVRESSSADFDKKLQNDWITAINNASIETVKQLKKQSKNMQRLFEISLPRIEHIHETATSFHNFSDELTLAMEKEQYEIDWITPQDIKNINDTFLNNLSISIVQTKTLSHYLGLQNICTLENRVSQVEKILQKALNADHENNCVLKDDLTLYANRYEEPLFFHKYVDDFQKICLKDIFTAPLCDIMDPVHKTPIIKAENIEKCFEYFFHQRPKDSSEVFLNVLFIEGQPALGKSSLVSWISWNALHQTATAQEVLGGRRLLVIRMRDLLSETGGDFNVQAPMYTILKYLYRNKLNHDALDVKYKHDASELFENSALILDGFDELCMMEDIQRDAGTVLFKNMYHELQKWQCNCKVLITSRPNYINMSQLEFPFMYIELQPFNAAKRREWLVRYSEKCPIKRELSELIGQEQSPNMEYLLQIPLVLYMISAKNTVIGKNENRWHLYYTIFHDEVYKRSYENLDEHITSSYRDNLYLLTAGIAYALCEERHFFISVEKLLEKKSIREIIDKMDVWDSVGELSVKKLKDILESCVALTSYFSIRSRDANGHLGKQIVEFCHNNIKDFFCCEYLWQNMQKLYERIPENGKIDYFMSFFQNLFQYTPFMKDDSSTGKKNVAVSFFCEKVEYYKQSKIQEDFILAELENRYFQKFFGKMLETGVVFDYKCDGKNNLLDMIANIYCSVLPIYKAIYMPYLSKEQRIELTDSHSQRINIGTSFIYEIIFRLANCRDHTFLRFDDILFSSLTFPNWDFSHSSFCDCLMRYTDFGKSNLQDVDFSGANLDYSDFRKAIINSKTCFAGCSCKMTKVTRTQAAFFEKYNAKDLDIYD